MNNANKKSSDEKPKESADSKMEYNKKELNNNERATNADSDDDNSLIMYSDLLSLKK